MKAVRIHEYGGISVLRFEDAPIPACEADEVLIRVVGSSVNPVDWKIREGHLRAMLAVKMPFVPGWDVSGVVHAVGARVTRFQLGDAVYSRPDIARDGTYAEFVAVRETEVACKPRTVSHIEAGVLPLAGTRPGKRWSPKATSRPGSACWRTQRPVAWARWRCRLPRRMARTSSARAGAPTGPWWNR